MPNDRIVTKALVLRVTQTKEADDILTVLTAEHGRLPVIARGARRKTSRLTAASQFLAFSEMVLYERHGWQLLSEATTIALFDKIRRDVGLLSLAAYFCELTELVTAEGEPSGEVLSLLLNALYALDTLDKPQEQVKAAFELKLLSVVGYQPLLQECAACGREHMEAPVFDAMQGVVLCKQCALGGAALCPASLAAMRHIVAAPSKRMLAFTLEDGAQKRLAAACEIFAETQLEHRFRTLELYKSLSRPAPDLAAYPPKKTGEDR